MTEQNPFRVTVYDKNFKRKGWVGSYESLTAIPTHNGIGTADLVLPVEAPRFGDLMQDGARVTIDYRVGDTWEHLLGGAIWNIGGQGPAKRAIGTFSIQDDFLKLSHLLAWPNPTQNIYHQGYDDDGELLGDYDRRTGTAETVLKDFVRANATRLGLPITIAPDQQRGAQVSVAMRFHYLTDDRLLKVVEQAGLGVSLRQRRDGVAGWILDVYEPVNRLRELSEASGVITNWSWSKAGPTASRVIAGGQGEGVDRDFELLTNLPLEQAWGPSGVIEVFRDARDVEIGNYDLLKKRAQQALTDGLPAAGLSLTLSETKAFRYGRTVRVGDRVKARVAPGVEITDILRSCTLTHARGSGLTVTPTVGDAEATAQHDTLVAAAIAKLAAGLRALRSER